MKILSTSAIRQWDEYTIQHEPISSIDLMERAALRCTEWLVQQYPAATSFGIFCGKGNNGGDGLAIARMLIGRNYAVTVHILEFGHLGTDDFQTNLTRLHHLPAADIHFIQSEQHLHPIPDGQIIIDAILGAGINREVEGITASLIDHMNSSGAEIVSIDIPSGIFVDTSSKGIKTIRANHTLSFQCYKMALLIPENSVSIGEVHIIDIGLHNDFYKTVESTAEIVDEKIIKSIYKPRNKFAHKGNFGHALLIAGSYGKIGAAVLSAKACLRSGVGLLTSHIPKCGYDILQSTVPEAMVVTDLSAEFISKVETDLEKYSAIGIGPGIGTEAATKLMLKELLTSCKKAVVLDADALNIIAEEKELMQLIPEGSILTPHPKEFERLFGKSNNDFERIQLAVDKAVELKCIIVLKGHHTVIATPGGTAYFNNTGNPGMATAGSGDVLTGIITGLLAQDYGSVETAILGVYLHGLAGDIAADANSKEAMVAGDIIEKTGAAFLQLNA
ncbi:MAG: NAD(P)H-hydrate dehydratase [Chitinophagaceae bacterium]|nr:NAD(P)H-hydrate dehydratase [Chitinophagaceae bacterium]